MNRDGTCTYAEIQQWPASVSLVTAAGAFGLSRTRAYELAKDGTFPARVVMVGRAYMVATESILAVLGAKEAQE